MRHEPLPEAAILGVAGVKLRRFNASRLFNACVARFDPSLHFAVEPRQLGDRIGCESRFVAQVLPPPQDHPKLRAPIAEMIVANHLMAERSHDARQAVADDGRPEMTHVHRLGDIGRRKIDDDGLGGGGLVQAECLVSQ